MSSTLIGTGSEHEARNCIDGDLTTACHSIFRDDPYPYIVLDFGIEVDVSRVEIINKMETKLNRIKVRVSNNFPVNLTIGEFHGGTLLGGLNGPFGSGQKLTISKEVTTRGGIVLENGVEN